MADVEKREPVVLPDGFDPRSESLKKKIHPKADRLNQIDVRKNGPTLICGANRKGKTCRQVAGAGTQHLGWGRCKFHGGMNTGAKTPEGKAITSQNARKHGLYSTALNRREREVYEGLLEEKTVSLTNEIMLIKAKLLTYLEQWREKWERYREEKLGERYARYRCKDCGKEMTRPELDSRKACGHCSSIGELIVVNYFGAERTELEAREYADVKTRVYFKEGENGARSYYHAGTVEDAPFMRSLDQLRRLVDSHAKLTGQDSGDVMDKVNQELRAASHAAASDSWGGPAVRREES